MTYLQSCLEEFYERLLAREKSSNESYEEKVDQLKESLLLLIEQCKLGESGCIEGECDLYNSRNRFREQNGKFSSLIKERSFYGNNKNCQLLENMYIEMSKFKQIFSDRIADIDVGERDLNKRKEDRKNLIIQVYEQAISLIELEQ